LRRKNTAHTYLNVDIKENEVKKFNSLLLPGYTYYLGIYYKNEIVHNVQHFSTLSKASRCI
jgi:uncharacterized membrane protein